MTVKNTFILKLDARQSLTVAHPAIPTAACVYRIR